MNAKIYNGNIQPNPKEYKIWVNDEGTIKTWNGTEWIESASSGGSGSGGENRIVYTDITKVPDEFIDGFIIFMTEVITKDGVFVSAFEVGKKFAEDKDWFDNNLYKIAASLDTKYKLKETYYTLEELCSFLGFDYTQYTITKEEYYSGLSA